jgi:MinD superfamily P-loop ATPase
VTVSQLVILSGKGGTGKTSLTAALADLAGGDGPDLVLVDADVDASNLDLVLNCQRVHQEVFEGRALAQIDPKLCSACGRCKEVCRFEAVIQDLTDFRIDSLACEGCAACLYECPENAILMKPQSAGEWYISETAFGRLFHAHLYPAQENSGKLVAHIKRQALDFLEERAAGSWMLVDGPPGIGCPVISAISGADAVLAVTEPSLSGIHDLKRLLNTVDYFGVPSYVAVNKADIYPLGVEKIKALCQETGAVLLGEIPFDLDIPKSMAAGIPVTTYRPDGAAARSIQDLWISIRNLEGDKKRVNQLLNLTKKVD